MFLGYNTNGFAHHTLEDTIDILAELGYGGIGLTVDYQHLNVLEPGWEARAEAIRGRLERHRLKCVVETGARFLLDPRRKHQPTLLSPRPEDRQTRIGFYRKCQQLAQILGSDIVSLWSGSPETGDDGHLTKRLSDGLRELCDSSSVKIAFEPEPGMLIDTMTRFAGLPELRTHDNFGLTLDVGHLICQREVPIRQHIEHWGRAGKLWNVHIEDMTAGVHDHLMFGEGEVDFAETFDALRSVGYTGGVFVELSRHSHNAVETARRSIDFLRRFV
jgi:L-ribulose-5-phosphate 3-epimerase